MCEKKKIVDNKKKMFLFIYLACFDLTIRGTDPGSVVSRRRSEGGLGRSYPGCTVPV